MAKFTPRQIVTQLDADFPTTRWEPGNFYVDRSLHHSKVSVIHEMLQHLDLGAYRLHGTEETNFLVAQMAVKTFAVGNQGDLQVSASLGRNPLAIIREVLLAAAAAAPEGDSPQAQPAPPSSTQPATTPAEIRKQPEARARHRAVILTALTLEFKAVVAHLRDLRKERHPNGTMYTTGTFGDGEEWTVSVAVVGAGNARAAQEAERAATHFKPETMFFVGVAGGRKDVKHGDVVASEKVYGYESGKATGKKFLPRPEVVDGSYALVQLAFHASTTDDWTKLVSPRPAPAPSVFVKPIASGEKLVGSSESSVAKLLGQTYGDALAVEMEGYGFLKAIHAMTGVSAIVLRGVSDLLDDKPNADASGTQELAARNAAAFAFQLLRDFSDSVGPTLTTPGGPSTIPALPKMTLETLSGLTLPTSPGTISSEAFATLREHVFSISTGDPKAVSSIRFRMQLPELVIATRVDGPAGTAVTLKPERMEFLASASGGGQVTVHGDASQAPAANLAVEIAQLLPQQTVRFRFLTIADGSRSEWSRERDEEIFAGSSAHYIEGQFLFERSGEYSERRFFVRLNYYRASRKIQSEEVEDERMQPRVMSMSS